MNIGVLGSGIVGQTVGGKLAGLGHSVVLGTRDPARVDEKKGYAPSLGEWLAGAGPNARVGAVAAAGAPGAGGFNPQNGAGAGEVLEAATAAVAGNRRVALPNPAPL